MRNYIISLLFCMTLGIPFAYSQSSFEYYNIKSRHVERLSKHIEKLYELKNCYENTDSIEVLHRIVYNYTGQVKPEVFIDKTFINYLKPVYDFKNCKKYPISESLVYSKEGYILAVSNGRQVYCLNDLYLKERYQRFLDVFKDVDTKNIIYINGSPRSIWILITSKDEFYIIDFGWNELKIIPIEEYMNNNWDSFSRLLKRFF